MPGTLRRHQDAIWTAIQREAKRCAGCVPRNRTNDEAYAFLWGAPALALASGTNADGSFTDAMIGLAVAVHSVRRLDRLRAIVIMVAISEADPMPSPLLLLARRYQPLRLRRVADLSSTVRIARECQSHQASRKESMLRNPAAMFNKFNVFGLGDEWRRVLYLDADVLLVRPVDGLWALRFDKAQIAAAARTTERRPVCRPGYYYTHNAGVFLLRPSRALFNAIRNSISDESFGHDEGFRCSSNGDQPMWNRLLAHSAPRAPYVRCLGHSWNCYHPEVLNQTRAMSYAEALHTLCADTSTGGHHDATIGSPSWDQTYAVDAKWNETSIAIAAAEPPASTKSLRAHPHVVHFATASKPWLRLANDSFYTRLWDAHKRAMLAHMFNGGT